MGKGFLESLIGTFVAHAAVQASKDANGKPDSYKAAGILYGAKGSLSDSDMAEVGAMLGAEGAFDDKD